MKRIALLTMIVTVSLLTGCVCSIGSPVKKGHNDEGIGRYQPIVIGRDNEPGKIDTRTGEVWIYSSGQWKKLQ